MTLSAGAALLAEVAALLAEDCPTLPLGTMSVRLEDLSLALELHAAAVLDLEGRVALALSALSGLEYQVPELWLE